MMHVLSEHLLHLLLCAPENKVCEEILKHSRHRSPLGSSCKLLRLHSVLIFDVMYFLILNIVDQFSVTQDFRGM